MASVSLRVPGYEDSDSDEPPDTSTPAPLSNPPPDHKLLTHLYDSLDELVDDLHEWGAQALFGITGRQSSTTKTGCVWQASAKARACNGRRWTLEIREGSAHNHAAAEGREDISTFRKFLPEHTAFVATFVNRPAVTNRQLAEALRNKFPGIVFTRVQLKSLRYRLQKAAADGYTPFQGTMKLLEERGGPYRVLWSATDPNKPEGLVWTDDFCKQQWALNPWVQMYDNTYKTNNKGLAFFQVMSIGTALNNEPNFGDDDSRIVERINRMAAQGEEVGPVPETVEYSRAGFKLTTNDFNVAWERLQAFFATQPAIIQYLERLTYQSFKINPRRNRSRSRRRHLVEVVAVAVAVEAGEAVEAGRPWEGGQGTQQG
ncbi:hypothetical protein N0V88_005043 [Collariella sp. IMI 366227]|nr:hypothetical protein N0V88_005043 [Collariella sp. IMI 366227]